MESVLGTHRVSKNIFSFIWSQQKETKGGEGQQAVRISFLKCQYASNKLGFVVCPPIMLLKRHKYPFQMTTLQLSEKPEIKAWDKMR